MQWQTIGHKNQKIFLENALKNLNFSHAYLFAGPAEVGKRTLALEFANKIFAATAPAGVQFDPANPAKVNPDLIVSGPEQNKIEDVRNLIRELALRPYLLGYKIAIIDNFENLTAEAANSILKTLEEPNSTTIIILISGNKKRLLPTVVSRCQTFDFSRITESELEARKLAPLFNGKIGKKIRFAQDSDYQNLLVDQAEQFVAIKKQNPTRRLLAIKNYAELESAELATLFENWLDHEHYDFTHGTAAKFRNPQLLVEALDGLHRNFNKKLVLEKLFLNLA